MGQQSVRTDVDRQAQRGDLRMLALALAGAVAVILLATAVATRHSDRLGEVQFASEPALPALAPRIEPDTTYGSAPDGPDVEREPDPSHNSVADHVR